MEIPRANLTAGGERCRFITCPIRLWLPKSGYPEGPTFIIRFCIFLIGAYFVNSAFDVIVKTEWNIAKRKSFKVQAKVVFKIVRWYLPEKIFFKKLLVMNRESSHCLSSFGKKKPVSWTELVIHSFLQLFCILTPGFHFPNKCL